MTGDDRDDPSMILRCQRPDDGDRTVSPESRKRADERGDLVRIVRAIQHDNRLSLHYFKPSRQTTASQSDRNDVVVRNYIPEQSNRGYGERRISGLKAAR